MLQRMPQVAYNISFTGRMEVTRQQQDTLRQIETAKKEIRKPFEFENRLSQFVVQQSEINSWSLRNYRSKQ